MLLPVQNQGEVLCMNMYIVDLTQEKIDDCGVSKAKIKKSAHTHAHETFCHDLTLHRLYY